MRHYNVAAFVHRHLAEAVGVSGGRELTVNCLWHDDYKHHLSINAKTGLFQCFSCGAKGTFWRFAQRVLRKEDIAAEMRSLSFETEDAETNVAAVKPTGWPDGYFPLQYPDSTQSAKLARQYLHGRGVGDALIIYHHIGHCIGGRYDRRVIVPVLNEQGDCCAFVARDYSGQQDPKVLTPPSTPGTHGVKDWIFNLDGAAHTGHIIVTEGVFSAISCGLSGIALFGKKATGRQLNLIKQAKPRRVTVCLDNDAAIEAEELAEQLALSVEDLRVARLPYGDPNDVPEEVLKVSLVDARPFHGFADPFAGIYEARA